MESSRSAKIMAMISKVSNHNQKKCNPREPKCRSSEGLIVSPICNFENTEQLDVLNLPKYESTKGLTEKEKEAAIRGSTDIYGKINSLGTSQGTLQSKKSTSNQTEINLDKKEKRTPVNFPKFNVSSTSLVPYSSSDDSSDGRKIKEAFPTDVRKNSNNETVIVNEKIPSIRNEKENKESFSPILDTAKTSSQNYDSDEINEQIQSNTNKKNSPRKVVVSQTNNSKFCRVWDKKDACLYCGKLVSKLPEHFQSVHSEEKEVNEFLGKKKGSSDRRLLISNLRRKGNFIHNKDALLQRKGTLLTCRRPDSSCSPEKFLPCEFCLGFYKRSKISVHVRKCKLNPKINEKRNNAVTVGEILLSNPDVVTEKLKTILKNMKNDHISLVARNDELIMKYGAMLCEKFEGQDHLSSYISQKLREVARLVIVARKFEDDITLRKLIDPSKFELLIQCARDIGGLNNLGEENSRPSLALKIGYTLKKCCRIVKCEAIMECDETKRKMVDDLMVLYDLEWSHRILQRAKKMLDKSRWNKPSLLPVAEDIKKFNFYINERQEELYKLLSNSKGNAGDFKEMLILTLAHVVTFNRKRVGDVEKIKLNTYLERPHHQQQGEIEASLSKCEKLLTKRMTLLTIRGKHDRGVPLLLTPTMVRNIDCLIINRKKFCVPGTNKYLFPKQNGDSHIRGCDALREAAQKCGATNSNYLTSTNLRKHIATVSQILNLTNNELEHLANHLGHSINVHRDYYRLPDTTIQLAKVSKLLIQFERGELEHGKSLDEVNLDIDDIVPQLEDHSDDEEKDTAEEENGGDKDDLQVKITSTKRKTRSKIRRNVTRNTRMQDTTDSDEAEVENKRDQWKKKTKCKKAKKPVEREIWDENQTKAVENFFKKEIVRNIVPSKDKCIRCLENSECLSSKSWKLIKWKVYNKIQKNKRTGQVNI